VNCVGSSDNISIAEPNLAVDLTLTEEPRFTKFKMEVSFLPPNFGSPKSERELPILVMPLKDSMLPRFWWPRMDKCGLCIIRLNMLQVEPSRT
jgi:hypothetical protein